MQTRRNAIRARRLSSVIFVWGLAVVAFSNCACNPNVRKAKYLQRGTRYFSAGKYSDAVLEYKNVIKIDPGYVDAHYQLAQCYQKLGMWGGASAELEKLLFEISLSTILVVPSPKARMPMVALRA